MGSLNFTVTRGGDTSVPVLVDYTTAGTGTNPVSADDHLNGVFPSGRITIAAGATSGTITIASNPDSTVEPDETGLLTITSPTAGVTISPSTAIYTFTNDDVAQSSEIVVYGPQTTADSGYVQVNSAKQKISGQMSDAVFAFSLGSNADGSDRLEIKHDGYLSIVIRRWVNGTASTVNQTAKYASGALAANSDFTLTHDVDAGKVTLVVAGSTRLNAFYYGTPATGTYARFQHNGGQTVTISKL